MKTNYSEATTEIPVLET